MQIVARRAAAAAVAEHEADQRQSVLKALGDAPLQLVRALSETRMGQQEAAILKHVTGIECTLQHGDTTRLFSH